LEDDHHISFEGEGGSIVQRGDISSFEVLEGVILEYIKNSLNLEVLFAEMFEGRNRVSKVGDGDFIGG
jgi:hypothetical protein